MTAEPEFSIHAELHRALDGARGPARVPEGKGGHVFVDGTLHRIKDIKTPLRGSAAFGFSVNEKELTHLCAHLDIKALGFKGLRTTTIAPLVSLSRLKYLSLWWVQKLADLAPLAEMSLDALVIDDIRYSHDIVPLSAIKKLRALTIAGGMNSDQVVETLTPLAVLPHLTELRLVSLKLRDDNLRPIADCKQLHDLWLPNTFPTEDYAYLRAKRPDLRCPALVAYQELRYHKGSKEVMVTGRRKPFLHVEKDAVRLARYKDQFDALVVGFQNDNGND